MRISEPKTPAARQFIFFISGFGFLESIGPTTNWTVYMGVVGAAHWRMAWMGAWAGTCLYLADPPTVLIREKQLGEKVIQIKS